MGRSISLSITVALSFAATSAADAQVALPSGTSVPGTGDASRISAGNRESNADYNRLVGAGARSGANADAPVAKRSAAVAATAADIKVGAALRDVKGVPIGTISQVDPDGVIVATGTTRIKVPMMGFGKDNQGLLLNLTAARFNELIAKAQASH